MSADPFEEDKGLDRSNILGGNFLKTFLYLGGNGSALRLFTSSGVHGYREADQYTIPPYRHDLGYFHPCYNLNKDLDKCNQKVPMITKLPGRCAACNTERQELMKCFTRTKYSHPLAPKQSEM